jgi:hypothetical protein
MMPVQNCLIVLRQASLETSTVYISCFWACNASSSLPSHFKNWQIW